MSKMVQEPYLLALSHRKGGGTGALPFPLKTTKSKFLALLYFSNKKVPFYFMLYFVLVTFEAFHTRLVVQIWPQTAKGKWIYLRNGHLRTPVCKG
jgi:hypothetical protein